MNFECHFVPINLKARLNLFLNNVSTNGIFLFELKKDENIQLLQFIEVNFIDSKSIKKLNKLFRNIDKATDVLSFNLIHTGEIDLCLEIIKDNSNNINIDFYTEVERCIIHGILHIIGYDHVEKLTPETLSKEPMFLLQENILSQCHIK